MQTAASHQAHRQGIIAVAAAALFWSSGGLFIKLLPFDAFTILFYRSSLAAIVFALTYRQEVFHIDRRTLLNSLFYAALLVAFVAANKLTTAANAIFLQYTAPIYILILEPKLFGLKLQRINVYAILACVAGMLLFAADSLESGNWAGDGLALFSGLMLAAFMLGQRLNAPSRQSAGIFWGNIIVALVGFPFFVKSPMPTPEQAMMLGWLGLFQIGLGYMLFTYGLKRILAIEASLLAMLEPILNPVWVFWGYGEKPGRLAIVGGAVIILALALRTWLLERQRIKASG